MEQFVQLSWISNGAIAPRVFQFDRVQIPFFNILSKSWKVYHKKEIDAIP